MAKADPKYPPGTRVRIIELYDGPHEGTVTGHGRDRNGIYTVVAFDDGHYDRFNRAWLTAIAGVPAS